MCLCFWDMLSEGIVKGTRNPAVTAEVYSRLGWLEYPHLQYAWQTGSRSVSGIKSVKIALKLCNLGAKSSKIELKGVHRGAVSRPWDFSLLLIGLAGLLYNDYHKLSIIHNQTDMRKYQYDIWRNIKMKLDDYQMKWKKYRNEIWNKTDEVLICRISLSLYLFLLGLIFFCDHPNVFITITSRVYSLAFIIYLIIFWSV